MSPVGLLAVYCALILLASLAGGWIPLLVRLTHTRLQVAQAGARFGYSLSGGDANQDVLEDVFIGAPYWDGNPNDNKGSVFIYYGIGIGGFDLTPDQLYSGQDTMTGEHFGSSVAFIPKLTSFITDPKCFISGAPEANPSNVANGGMAIVYRFGTQPPP